MKLSFHPRFMRVRHGPYDSSKLYHLLSPKAKRNRASPLLGGSRLRYWLCPPLLKAPIYRAGFLASTLCFDYVDQRYYGSKYEVLGASPIWTIFVCPGG